MTVQRDWPIWKWAAASAALLLAPAGLWGLATWVAPGAGLGGKLLIGNGILAAGLAVWWLGRGTETDDVAASEARDRHETEVDRDEAERRSRIGLLLGLALASTAAFFMEGGPSRLVEALEFLPSMSLGAILLIGVHVSLLAGAMAVILTDRWPLFTLAGLILLLVPSVIADGALALGLSAVLVPIVALLLTLRSWKASFWFCLVAGLEWMLWTTVADGAAVYDPIDGVTGAAWAFAAAFLAWTNRTRRQPS